MEDYRRIYSEGPVSVFDIRRDMTLPVLEYDGSATNDARQTS